MHNFCEKRSKVCEKTLVPVVASFYRLSAFKFEINSSFCFYDLSWSKRDVRDELFLENCGLYRKFWNLQTDEKWAVIQPSVLNSVSLEAF